MKLVNLEHPGYQVAIAHKQALYQYILKLAQDAKLKQPETLARQLMLLAEGAIVTSMMEGHSKSAQQAREVASVLIAMS